MNRFILLVTVVVLAGCGDSGSTSARRRVIGVTLLSQTHAFVKDLEADVIQHPRRIGETAIEMIARHLAGKKVPARVHVEVGIMTAPSLSKQ